MRKEPPKRNANLYRVKQSLEKKFMDTRTFSEGSLKNRKGENFRDKTFELPFCDLKKNLGEKTKNSSKYVIKIRFAKGKTHKCIITYDSYVDDENCDRKYCFFCQIPEKSIFVLRGQIPSDNERKYFVITNPKNTEIRGLTKTECFHDEGKWNFHERMVSLGTLVRLV